MNPPFRSLLVGACAALILTLGTQGCARRAAEAPPESAPAPPVAESVPPETAPPVIERQSAPPNIDPAYFEFDSYRLTPSGREALDRAARALREQTDLEVTIEGHCDERGTIEYNLSLGEQRARAARGYLEAAGVAKARMQIISYGKERPLDQGHDEAAWAKNRRAHFVVRRAGVAEATETSL